MKYDADAAPDGPAREGVPVPLTPAQHWFFAQDPVDPQRYNQGVALRLRAPVTFREVQEILDQVAAAHDAFGLRFHRSAAGQWRQVATLDLHVPLEASDLSGLTAGQQESGLAELADWLHGSLDLTAGPVGCAALADLGAGHDPLLLVIAHHLIIDAVSWRILVDDIEAAWGALRAGQPPPLKGGMPFQAWAATLAAQAGGWDEEVGYWTARVPVSDPWAQQWTQGISGASASAGLREPRRHRLTLEATATRRLLAATGGTAASIDHVLLATVASTVRAALGITPVLIDVETHGREGVGADVSRTVGWLTATWPVSIEVGELSTVALAAQVAEATRGLPRGGVGYGALRWVTPRAAVRSLPQAHVLFTYLGRYQTRSAPGRRVEWVLGLEGGSNTAFRSCPYVLIANAWIQDDELMIDWIWLDGAPGTEGLAEAAETVIPTLRDAAEAIPSHPASRPGLSGTEPATATEGIILSAWQEVLDTAAPWNDPVDGGAREIGVEDDFFDAGGDSIHMIQVVSRLRRAFGVRVPLRIMREHPTARSLASEIDAMVAAADNTAQSS